METFEDSFDYGLVLGPKIKSYCIELIRKDANSEGIITKVKVNNRICKSVIYRIIETGEVITAAISDSEAMRKFIDSNVEKEIIGYSR